MMDDEKIIACFFARSEEAIHELDAKYGAYCRRIAQNIVNSPEDAEECVNDAYFGVWNAIPPAHPKPLLTFVCKIVRNQALMRYHANTAAKRSSMYAVALEELSESLPSASNVEAELEVKETVQMIEGFLDRLPLRNRVIFLRRYWYFDSYAQIAQQVGISAKNVSVSLASMRKQLRSYLLEMGAIE